MKIESKFNKIEVFEDVLTFENKVKSRFKKCIYNFKIVNTEDIENDKIEIELENNKTSKIIDSIIIDVID